MRGGFGCGVSAARCTYEGAEANTRQAYPLTDVVMTGQKGGCWVKARSRRYTMQRVGVGCPCTRGHFTVEVMSPGVRSLEHGTDSGWIPSADEMHGEGEMFA
jgi:hypothetical protein